MDDEGPDDAEVFVDKIILRLVVVISSFFAVGALAIKVHNFGIIQYHGVKIIIIGAAA